MSTRTLRCPNCDGSMREIDRRGLLIDICNECKGIFLDRGELEKLLETVDRWAEAQAAGIAAPEAPGTPPTAPTPPQPGHPAPGPGTLPTAPPPPPGHHPGPGPGTPPMAPPPPPPGQYGQPAPYAAQPGPYARPQHGSGLGGIAEVLSAVVRESKGHGKGHGYGYGYGRKRHKKGGLGELFDDLLG
jgi:hypothetical protein